jgi:hypothetical protein
LAHDVALLIRQDFRDHIVNAELAPDAAAVVALSPVSITIRRPSARSARIASGCADLIGSETASNPAGFPSIATR